VIPFDKVGPVIIEHDADEAVSARLAEAGAELIRAKA